MNEESTGCIGIVIFLLLFSWFMSSHNDKIRSEAYSNGYEDGHDNGYIDGQTDAFEGGNIRR